MINSKNLSITKLFFRYLLFNFDLLLSLFVKYLITPTEKLINFSLYVFSSFVFYLQNQKYNQDH